MIGVYAPSTRSRSGIGLYGQLAVDVLRRGGMSAVVVEREPVDPRGFDRVLYNIGGGEVDWPAFAASRVRPGPIILHEHNLTEFFCHNEERLDDELRADVLARRDRVIGGPADDRLRSWLRSDRRNQYLDLGLEQLPVRNATAVLTHSPVVATLLRQRYPGVDVRVLDFPIDDRTTAPPVHRAELGIPPAARVVGSFGFAAGNKHIDALVEAWQRIAVPAGEAVLLLAGPGMSRFDSGGQRGVTVVDHVADRGEFLALMRLADIGVQLRRPSLGETSATASELLAMGKPVIVSDASVLPTWADRRRVRFTGADHSPAGLAETLRRSLGEPSAPVAPIDAAATRNRWLDVVRRALLDAPPEIAAGSGTDRADLGWTG